MNGLFWGFLYFFYCEAAQTCSGCPVSLLVSKQQITSATESSSSNLQLTDISPWGCPQVAHTHETQ